MPKPEPSVVSLDPKTIAALLGALGILALAAAGAVVITTPGEQECAIELSDKKAELADARARLELLTEVKDACKDALRVCVPPVDPGDER